MVGTAGTACGWAWTRWWPDRTVPFASRPFPSSESPGIQTRPRCSLPGVVGRVCPTGSCGGLLPSPCPAPARPLPTGRRRPNRHPRPAPSPNGSLAPSTILPSFSQNRQITSPPKNQRLRLPDGYIAQNWGRGPSSSQSVPDRPHVARRACLSLPVPGATPCPARSPCTVGKTASPGTGPARRHTNGLQHQLQHGANRPSHKAVRSGGPPAPPWRLPPQTPPGAGGSGSAGR